jgi:hypothetical protein
MRITDKRLWLLPILFLGLGGCGGPSLVPLEGTVTFNGTPLAGATLTLQGATGPVEERIYVGQTDANGHYTVGPSWTSGVGVLPGSYQVFIQSVKLPDVITETTKLPPDPVPMQYRDGSQKLEVPVEGLTTADFNIQAAGRR